VTGLRCCSNWAFQFQRPEPENCIRHNETRLQKVSKLLTKMTLTTQGWAALVENPQNRFEAIQPMFKATGIKLLEYWFAIDQGAI
jgi:hypothetical protein